jgi:hypothetical protein
MAQSYAKYTSAGDSLYVVPFPYIKKEHVTASVNGANVSFTWNSANVINISPTPQVGDVVYIERNTPNDTRVVDFVDGSTLGEADLDAATIQLIYIAQEAKDKAELSPRIIWNNTIDLGGRRAVNAGTAIVSTDLTTKQYVDDGDTSVRQYVDTGMTNQLNLATAAKGAAIAARDAAIVARDAAIAAATAALNYLSGQFIRYALIPDPTWSNLRVPYDGLHVDIGNTPIETWPGGGDYGVASAITGSVKVPAAADSNYDGATPLSIINAGVSGVALTQSDKQPVVGVYGGSCLDRTHGNAWGMNATAKNWANSGNEQSDGYEGNITGLEIDASWKLPPVDRRVGGSNIDGLWIPAELYGGRPDGTCNAIHIGIYGEYPWKKAILSDHGAADYFAQIGMGKKQEVDGPAGSQSLYFLSSSGGVKTSGGDTNVYHHSLMSVSPGGEFIFQPNYAGGSGNLIVGNSDLSQISSLHPVNGFSGPKVTTATLDVTGNATVNGTVAATNLAASTLALQNIATGPTYADNAAAAAAGVAVGGVYKGPGNALYVRV